MDFLIVIESLLLFLYSSYSVGVVMVRIQSPLVFISFLVGWFMQTRRRLLGLSICLYPTLLLFFPSVGGLDELKSLRGDRVEERVERRRMKEKKERESVASIRLADHHRHETPEPNSSSSSPPVFFFSRADIAFLFLCMSLSLSFCCFLSFSLSQRPGPLPLFFFSLWT